MRKIQKACGLEDRRPATRLADIPPEVREALSTGQTSAKNLIESLATDQYRLAATVLPPLGLDAAAAAIMAAGEPRDTAIAAARKIAGVLSSWIDPRCENFQLLATHPSDGVRCWAALLIGLDDVRLPRRLAYIKPLANDDHFGVREIAWMAMRPHYEPSVVAAITALLPWTGSRSENLRRFAIESTRPRGVWCKQLIELVAQPELAEQLLEAVKADDSPYVQRSVSNWLSDAARSRPDWVRQLINRWQDGADQHTEAICRRVRHIE